MIGNRLMQNRSRVSESCSIVIQIASRKRNSKPTLHNVCTFNTALKMYIKQYWLHQMRNVLFNPVNRRNGLTALNSKNEMHYLAFFMTKIAKYKARISIIIELKS